MELGKGSVNLFQKIVCSLANKGPILAYKQF